MGILADDLAYEIDRCIDLIADYRAIPTGSFGAETIKAHVMGAIRAAIAQDLPAMIATYKHLKNCS